MLRALLIGSFVLAITTGCASVDIQKLQTAAAQGDPVSQFQLGYIYDGGVGVKQDFKEAFKWYSFSAEQGYAEAQNSLGSLYLAGEGVSQNYELARMWFQKAADQGDARAKNSLAYLYDLGLGVPASPKLAADLYEQAAELGDLWAMLNLGILLTQGKPGVKIDYVEAYKWLDLVRFYTHFSKDMRLKWGARGELDRLSKIMTYSQMEEGKKRAGEWDRIHRKK